MGERRGTSKPRNTNRGLMGMDNEGGLTVGVMGGWGRGAQWRERQDNCNWTTIKIIIIINKNLKVNKKQKKPCSHIAYILWGEISNECINICEIMMKKNNAGKRYPVSERHQKLWKSVTVFLIGYTRKSFLKWNLSSYFNEMRQQTLNISERKHYRKRMHNVQWFWRSCFVY